MTSNDPLLSSTIDGRLRLDRLLGSGGMGKVYLATQLSVNRQVAVKLLRPDLSEIETIQKRFFREAQLVASIRHPNVVGLIDFGKDAETGSLFISMEYVSGQSLTEVIQGRRMPLRAVLDVFRQICSGLSEAHSMGVIHRDLKPDNVMLQLTAEGRITAKLLDFGIALPQGESENRFTETGAVIGTPHYMSPEQAQGHPVSVRSDLYAVGAMMYQALSGSLPFQADTPLALMFKTVNEKHTPLGLVMVDELPPSRVTELVDRLLAKSPGERPESAAAVGRAIDELLADMPNPAWDDFESFTQAMSPAIPTPSGLSVGSTARDDEPPSIAPQRQRSIAPLVIVAVAVLFVLVVAIAAASILAFATLRKPQPEAPPRISRELLRAPVRPTVAEPPDGIWNVAPEPEPERKPEKKPRKQKKAKPPKRSTKLSKETKQHTSCMGGNCTADLTEGGQDYVCMADSTCTVDCSGGGCGQKCMGSTCTFECSGGGCTQQCFGGATCAWSCEGGGCQRNAFSGSEVTDLD